MIPQILPDNWMSVQVTKGEALIVHFSLMIKKWHGYCLIPDKCTQIDNLLSVLHLVVYRCSCVIEKRKKQYSA